MLVLADRACQIGLEKSDQGQRMALSKLLSGDNPVNVNEYALLTFLEVLACCGSLTQGNTV